MPFSERYRRLGAARALQNSGHIELIGLGTITTTVGAWPEEHGHKNIGAPKRKDHKNTFLQKVGRVWPSNLIPKIKNIRVPLVLAKNMKGTTVVVRT